MKLLTIGLTLIICLWPHATSAQFVPSAVLDTEGNPLRAGVEYYIMPAAALPYRGGLASVVGPSDDPCLGVVGLSNNFTAFNPAVTFAPLEDGEVVRETQNFVVTFSGLNPCGGPSTWRAGRFDAWARSRLIEAGFLGTQCVNLFYLSPAASVGVFEHAYTFEWCPTLFCPWVSSSACGTMGLLNYIGGIRVFVLGGSSGFPVVFQRVYYTDGHVKQA